MNQRTCCDGLCTQGRSCPAFAPGVIEGPTFRRSNRQLWRLLVWLFRSGILMLLMALIGFAAGVLS